MAILGTGILMWEGSERRSDRYGYVYLLDDKRYSRDKWHSIAFTHKNAGEHGRLVAKVISTRQSGHIGDLFHMIFPRTPEVGQEIILGTGTVNYQDHQDTDHGNRTEVGLFPDDSRKTQWLDIRALYDTHEQTIELRFEPDGAQPHLYKGKSGNDGPLAVVGVTIEKQ